MEVDVGCQTVFVAISFQTKIHTVFGDVVGPLDLIRHFLHLRVVELMSPGDVSFCADNGIRQQFNFPVAEGLSSGEAYG